MKNTVVKYFAVIVLIILACTVLVRTVTGSETVADYAKTHPVNDAVQPTVEVVEDINETIETSNGTLDEENETKEAEELVAENELQDTEAEESLADELADTEEPHFYIEEISDELKESMRGKSYADNIDESIVNFDMLRHVVIYYNDFDNNSVKGELICSELIAQDLLEIFEELYHAGYQFEEVALIDKYDADDDASMEANNTSCFNYRVVDNTTKLSYHAYGLAIDVNPFYNPYVQFRNGADYICPEASAEYADRTADFPYKIDENDLAYKLFKEHGFTWGGNWNSCKDYQHFEKRLR